MCVCILAPLLDLPLLTAGRPWDALKTAKKEDDPEQALKEFKTIVDQETEKGDW
jgi:hypothetical protein